MHEDADFTADYIISHSDCADMQVVSARFPSLSKYVSKLIEIYCALCSDVVTNGDGSNDDSVDDSANTDVITQFLRRVGRPVSTRCVIASCLVLSFFTFMWSQFLFEI